MTPRLLSRFSLVTTALTATVLLTTTACGGGGRPATTPGADQGSAAADARSLFERLGGLPAIEAVVKRFVAVTGSDPRISMFFTNADVPRLEKMMVEHICQNTGGPCTYSGKSMKESHTGMKVKKEHFTAFIEDLTRVLEEFKVGAREKTEVLAFFNSLEGDIVEP